MSAQLEPRCFNVTEYYKMAKAGIVKPDDRVELIERDAYQDERDWQPSGCVCISVVRLLAKARNHQAA